MKYSIIVPVYNRPEEINELLESLTKQSIQNFEVIIVEDGSQVPCLRICNQYEDKLDLHYYSKANSGPGQSRNYGAQRASGTYLIILDSDVVLPPDYLKAVDEELCRRPADAFGGPDCAHASFTNTQKAISYSMTSFFTTGGIRGGKKKLDRFYPRSFNMGVRREVYYKLGGFSRMRFGEDIDFSIRIFKNGYQCRLFPQAWVWHKRRTDFRKFYRQVFNSGIARINLYKKYPESLKAVHLLPTIFTIGVIFLIILTLILRIFILSGDHDANLLITNFPLTPIILYAFLIFLHSTFANKSIKIGALSIVAAFIQLFGYGMGMMEAWWKRCVMGENEFSAFDRTFYK